MNLNFRIAKLNDITEINDLVNSAYRGELSKTGWTTEANILDGQRSDPEEITKIISDKDQAIILCMYMQQIVGTVVVQKKTDHAYIGMLTVKPTLQNSGIGKHLLNTAEEFITKEWQLNKIQMTVIKQRTELLYWYNKHGYISTGETKPFPYDNPRFGIPKVNGLEFTVLEKNRESYLRSRL